MAQPLWYIRKSGAVTGPFPTPQINEMLRAGQLRPGDEVSLDRVLWEPIEQSGHFGARRAEAPAKPKEDDTWEQERAKARQRWLLETGAGEGSDLDSLQRAELQALRQDEETTRELIHAQARRPPSFWIALLALAAIVAVGGAVWFGQSEKGIQASIGQAGIPAGGCAAPAGEGVTWAGCDRRQAILTAAVLRGAHLAGGKFDGADLSAADLSYADLKRASLRGANLARANLLGANLDGADLTGADLASADLRYATLTGALLEGARLDGAQLGKATWHDGHSCGEAAIGTCP